jgi:hypothetical protein
VLVQIWWVGLVVIGILGAVIVARWMWQNRGRR